jgi:hypothetical protein
VESSCEIGIEPSGSINAGKVSSVLTTGDHLGSAQLHRVSYFGSYDKYSLCRFITRHLNTCKGDVPVLNYSRLSITP